MNSEKPKRYEKKYLIIGGLLYVTPPAILFVIFGNKTITGLAEKLVWLTPVFLLAGVLLMIIGLRPTITLKSESDQKSFDWRNGWSKTKILKSLIYLPIIIGFIIMSFGISSEGNPFESNYFKISIVFSLVGLILILTNNWLQIISEKKLPNEFRERDEREKLITGLAARKVYIISQNILSLTALISFYIALDLRIKISFWWIPTVLLAIYSINHFVFLYFTRKKYDPTPLNPNPPNNK